MALPQTTSQSCEDQAAAQMLHGAAEIKLHQEVHVRCRCVFRVRATKAGPRTDISRRRKFAQIIDAEGLFEFSYLTDHLFEAIFAEFLPLVSFEVFSMGSNSFGETTLLSAGKSTVSSRAWWGRYIRMKACMVSTSL